MGIDDAGCRLSAGVTGQGSPISTFIPDAG